MRITTRDHVNARTADGRVYAAGEGAVTDVDDSDEGLVAMFRDLEARGLITIHDDGQSEPSEPSEPEPEETPPTALSRPSQGDPKSDWVGWHVDSGNLTREEAESMTKQDLIELSR